MSNDPHDVVRVAAGDMVTIELYQQRLAEEGIAGRVVGENLEGSFGTALALSVELWVHLSDAVRAEAAIREMEEMKGQYPPGETESGAAAAPDS